MAATSSRTLRLLSLLQNHRYLSGGELAEELEVSIRTLRRDIDRLRELGYPVSANRGVDGGYQLEAGATLPPLLLDDEEAVGLAVALQTAAQESVAGIAEAALRALAKLTQVMPPRLRHRVDALRGATEVPTWSSEADATSTPETLVAIALACRDSERLTFGYRSAINKATDRQVEPLRLVSLGRRWYLVAYDLDRHDWRTFRMDRIDEPRPTGQRFRTRELPASDAASFVRQGIDQLRSAYEVEVLISAPARRVRDLVGRWGDVTPIDDMRCRLIMRAESLDWPAMALGTLGAPFQVVRPPELTHLLAAWSDLFAVAVQPFR
jgi:predicted DNA-binding transcriptional regulator YafY